MRRRYGILLGIGISLLTLALILTGVDLQRVRSALAEADYRFVLPAFALLVIGHVTRAVRWRALLMDRLPLLPAFSVLNISYLLNGALPFRLGEVARIFLATQAAPPIPAFTALSTILVERLLDLLAVMGMLGLVLVTLPVPAAVTTAGVTLGVGALAGVGVLSVIARRREWAFRILSQAERWLPLLRPGSLHGAVGRFIDGLQPLTFWRGVFRAVFWSGISWGFSILAGYILLYAFYPQPTWPAVLMFIVMAALAVSVPYVPGAVGPYEAGVVMALSLTGFGQPEGAAVAFAIVLHATNLSVYTLLGVLGLLQQGVTLGQVVRGARNLRPAPTPGLLE